MKCLDLESPVVVSRPALCRPSMWKRNEQLSCYRSSKPNSDGQYSTWDGMELSVHVHVGQDVGCRCGGGQLQLKIGGRNKTQPCWISDGSFLVSVGAAVVEYICGAAVYISCICKNKNKFCFLRKGGTCVDCSFIGLRSGREALSIECLA